MIGGGDEVGRDLVGLVVPVVGSVDETGDRWDPYRLIDATGTTVGAVSAFLRDLQAAGRSVVTQRSYAMDLLRWFRFLWAVEVSWREATRVEARDFLPVAKVVRQADSGPAICAGWDA